MFATYHTTTRRMAGVAQLVQIATPFIWGGMVGAISFLEAPLKFRAPGITLPLGLGIGRLVFTALNRIECGLAAILALAYVLHRPPRAVLALFGGAAAILLGQTAWLRPALDRRATLTIAGTPPPRSHHHRTFVVLEGVKLGMLIVLGIITAQHMRDQPCDGSEMK
jgi:hypothetical protein